MNATATQELARRWSDEIAAVEFPPSPGWLDALRKDAVGRFGESGLPHRKVEAWRYTPLKRLEAMDPGLPLAGQERAPGSLPDVLAQGPATVVDIVDGQLQNVSGNSGSGLVVLSLEEALENHEERIRALAEKIDISGPSQAFAALNTAYLHRGILIRVAEGVDAGTLVLRWSEGAGGRFSPCRVMFLLEAGSRLELLEQYLGGGAEPGVMNVMLQAQLGEGAELNHVRVQDEHEEAILLTSTSVELAADGRYGYHGFDLGGGLVRHELHAELAGSGAFADLAGACVLDGSRHADTRVSVDHAAPDCSSEQLFRTVLGGRSRGVFNGRALIRKGADGSSVQQSNANLLLSRLAEMDAKPELEIYADEVVASHGATVGHLDETAVFYLRSRGLCDAEARRILTAAFCHAVTSRLEDRDLAEKIGEMVDAAMPKAT